MYIRNLDSLLKVILQQILTGIIITQQKAKLILINSLQKKKEKKKFQKHSPNLSGSSAARLATSS